MSLETPEKIRSLQRKLYVKAKVESAFRFYVLYDKICRPDILLHAYKLARFNAGAPGVDGVTFEQIEASGLEAWLVGLREDLVSKRYRPDPVRRVMIPKASGDGERPRPCGAKLTFDKYIIGVAAVGLNLGAYGAELVRGAIQSVPRGQWEASYALSMSPYAQMRRIILPQAFIAMLPPWGNLIIELLKSTALVALIAVPDLMFEARQINGSTYLSAQAFGTALVVYYILARLIVTPFMRWLERAMARTLGRG